MAKADQAHRLLHVLEPVQAGQRQTGDIWSGSTVLVQQVSAQPAAVHGVLRVCLGRCGLGRRGPTSAGGRNRAPGVARHGVLPLPQAAVRFAACRRGSGTQDYSSERADVVGRDHIQLSRRLDRRGRLGVARMAASASSMSLTSASYSPVTRPRMLLNTGTVLSLRAAWTLSPCSPSSGWAGSAPGESPVPDGSGRVTGGGHDCSCLPAQRFAPRVRPPATIQCTYGLAGIGCAPEGE